MDSTEKTLIELSILILAGIIAALIRRYCLYNQTNSEEQTTANNESKRDRSNN